MQIYCVGPGSKAQFWHENLILGYTQTPELESRSTESRNVENTAYSMGNTEYGRHGVWKTRSMENTALKPRSMENTEYGNHGVYDRFTALTPIIG